MSLRRQRERTAPVKPKGSSDGNVGMLLQQSCPPRSRHWHPLLLHKTQWKYTFLAEILLFSILAEVGLFSVNATPLLPFPNLTCSTQATYQLRRGLLVLLSPTEVQGARGTRWGRSGDSSAAGQTRSPDATKEPPAASCLEDPALKAARSIIHQGLTKFYKMPSN